MVSLNKSSIKLILMIMFIIKEMGVFGVCCYVRKKALLRCLCNHNHLVEVVQLI